MLLAVNMPEQLPHVGQAWFSTSVTVASSISPAAYWLTAEGFAEREHVALYGVTMSLVTIAPTLLLNIGQDDVARRLEEEIGHTERLVYIRQLVSGRVVVVESVPTDFPGEADRLAEVFAEDVTEDEAIASQLAE